MGVMSDKQDFVDDIRVRIPAGWKARLESEAAKENLKVSDIVRRAVDRLLGPAPAAKRKASK